jgi:2-oxoglutarate dehydrogenase E2 component (dihydrolipoamide succinyltransferase)
MTTETVTMPKLGESVTEGTITAWLKAVGDRVEIDDPLFEVSTDKVDSEIPSPFEGTLVEILVAAGETVPIDTPLARVGEPAPAVTASASISAAAPPVRAAAGAVPLPVGSTVGGNGGRILLSPLVRRLAAEHHVDLTTVQGSGEAGRIRREDVERLISAGPTLPNPPLPLPSPPAAPAAPPVATPPPVPAPPTSAPVTTAPPTAAPITPVPAAEAGAGALSDGRTEMVPLSRIRLVTAEHMVRSKQISPHVWTSVEVDLERVEQLRLKHKDRFKAEEGASLTYLVFIARAVCDALRAFPALNSSIDLGSKTQTFHRYVHLGIAVDLDEQGLVVPVVKDADSLNLRGLARGIKAKADAARAKKLGADDYAGSTFTITNPGPLGDYASAPIINQPNVAILSTNMVERRPTVVGDAIAIHHMSILGISYDHRAVDGVTVSKFLRSVKQALAERDWEAELG